jgi:signal transduction histidine kinase/ligand-binding sensor domain-containing protein
MDRARGRFERYQYDPSDPSKLSRPPLGKSLSWTDDFISFIKEDKEGRIWIGSFLGGINVYDPSTKQTSFYGIGRNAKGNLAGNQIGPAYKTRDNTLWIGSYGPNLYKVNPYQHVQPHTRTGRLVFCFAEDAAHDLWMGTDRGLVHKESNGNEAMYLVDKDSTSQKNQVFYIENDNNKFWLVTFHGLHLFDPDTKIITSFYHQPGNTNSLLSDSVNWVKKETDNQLWVATVKGLDLMDLKSKTVKHFQHVPGDPGSISSDSIFSVSIDRKQNLWAGTYYGLNRLDKKTGNFRKYLDKLFVFSTKEDSEGQLWCGTSSGLYKYDSNKDLFYNFSNEFKLTGPSASGGWLVEDSAQNLWMNTNTGIFQLSKARNRMVLYSRKQGIDASVLLPCGYVRKNGEILWGDTSGYFKLGSHDLSALSAPEINVSSFLLNNTLISPSADGILSLPLMQTRQILLNHDQNTFSFGFTHIDFISEPEDARLFYMLQNYDNEWRIAGDERKAYYFNLAPGNYIFKIKAYNVAGLSAEKDIAVIITPPWWKRWWVYAIAAMVLGSIVYGLYHNHINQLNRRQAAQMNVMVATQEIERKRIARDLHDDVGTKLSALKMSLSSLHEEAMMANNEKIKRLSQNSDQFITEVMQDVRQLLINLSPAVLEEFGYSTAVEGLVNKINETKQLHFNLVIFGMDQPLPKDMELALYRITQELINNVLKHAEAKNVSLQIGGRDGKIILMIEDDGKGFDKNEHREGYGLKNLAARTALLHGRMTIDSLPGKGTSVLIEIPYNFSI